MAELPLAALADHDGASGDQALTRLACLSRVSATAGRGAQDVRHRMGCFGGPEFRLVNLRGVCGQKDGPAIDFAQLLLYARVATLGRWSQLAVWTPANLCCSPTAVAGVGYTYRESAMLALQTRGFNPT